MKRKLEFYSLLDYCCVLNLNIFCIIDKILSTNEKGFARIKEGRDQYQLMSSTQVEADNGNGHSILSTFVAGRSLVLLQDLYFAASAAVCSVTAALELEFT